MSGLCANFLPTSPGGSCVKRLTDQEFWERQYRAPAPVLPKDGSTRPYQYAVFWDDIIPNHLRPTTGSSVVEVGSAPGLRTVKLAREYGLEPFCLEYTDEGARQNREVFEAAGCDPSNVLQRDLFGDIDDLRERFNLVVSFGFIEHFDDPRAAIPRHIDLCKPGGHVVITIPNYAGLTDA